MAEDEADEFPLHNSVFTGNIKKFSSTLKIRKNLIDGKDKHGNTALHLAVMLGKPEFIFLLLNNNAAVNLKNSKGWTPLAEAISFGHRPTISLILRKLKEQSRSQMNTRRPKLLDALKMMGDFYMELKWDFSSWVPLISRILPSDVCKISKLGSNIRLDTTLIDFSEMHWQRGDISFIFRGDMPPKDSLTVLDNEAKCFQHVRPEESEMEIEDEVDILMASDILATQMSTKNVTFSKAQSGWIFKEDKKETVGQYDSDFYTVNGLTLEQRKRREHLSRDDLQKNKVSIVEALTKAQPANIDPNEVVVIQRRSSLQPPDTRNITWEEYIKSEIGEYPNLGRDIVFKRSYKPIRATVAMSKDFPLTVEMLLNVLEVIAPFKHLNKLREFVTMKLPCGFPVKIELPILATVSAKVTFQEFRFCDDIKKEMFLIPDDFIENSTRFPDL